MSDTTDREHFLTHWALAATELTGDAHRLADILLSARPPRIPRCLLDYERDREDDTPELRRLIAQAFATGRRFRR